MTPDPKPKHYKKRKPPGHDKKYLAWVREQPCVRCWSIPCEPAHQRILGNAGTGMKSPDRDALPLCRNCHDEEHHGAVTFWGQKTKPKTKEYVARLCREHLKRYEEGL